jgi:hypothetical protein
MGVSVTVHATFQWVGVLCGCEYKEEAPRALNMGLSNINASSVGTGTLDSVGHSEGRYGVAYDECR